MPVTTKLTHFPNGVGQFTFVAVPGVAGNLVCTGVRLATDRLLGVIAVTHTNGVASASADLTGEFTITADNQINNTGGTSTANNIVLVTVARKATRIQ
jgi:hypothetical protein